MLKILEIHGMKERLREVEAYLEQALHFEHAAIREKALKTLHAGGKRVRPALAIMTAGMYGKEKEIIPLAAALEMVHMASLIHDDVVDQADTRRGQATTEVTLLFPLFVIFIVFIIKVTGLLVLNQKMQIAAVYAARRFQLQSHVTAYYANGWDKRYLMPRIEDKVKEYVGFNNEGMRKFLSLRDIKVKIDPTTTWTKVTITAYMTPLRIRFL